MARNRIYSILVLLSLVFLSCETSGANEQNRGPNAQTGARHCAGVNDLECEIEVLKHKVHQLESTFEEATEKLNAKDLHTENLEKSIELMNDEIRRLQSLLLTSKGTSSEEEKLKALEEEIELLSDISRKNNIDIRTLESRADEAENQVVVSAAEAEQMASIVTELWIQIQQLQQALKITEIRRAELQSQIGSKKCTFLKVIRILFKGQPVKVMELFHYDASTKSSIWRFCLSASIKHVEGFLSAIKKYHHKLQGVVKREMQRHKLTSFISNKEVVFLVASFLIIFPAMTAWMLMSSLWRCST